MGNPVPTLQAEVEKCRTATLAANCMVTELAAYLDELKAEAEGWRRRNLIVDSQAEREEQAIRRLEALAAAWEAQLATISGLDRLDMQLKKLNAAILKEAVPKKTEGSQEPTEDRADGITVNLRRTS